MKRENSPKDEKVRKSGSRRALKGMNAEQTSFGLPAFRSFGLEIGMINGMD